VEIIGCFGNEEVLSHRLDLMVGLTTQLVQNMRVNYELLVSGQL